MNDHRDYVEPTRFSIEIRELFQGLSRGSAEVRGHVVRKELRTSGRPSIRRKFQVETELPEPGGRSCRSIETDKVDSGRGLAPIEPRTRNHRVIY